VGNVVAVGGRVKGEVIKMRASKQNAGGTAIAGISSRLIVIGPL
jgi:hypothetical protein